MIFRCKKATIKFSPYASNNLGSAPSLSLGPICPLSLSLYKSAAPSLLVDPTFLSLSHEPINTNQWLLDGGWVQFGFWLSFSWC